MDDQNCAHWVETFRERCRQRGVPFTIQRRVTYEALLGRTDHPTADQVHEDVRDVLPGVSRMTVYRVLELLVDVGLVKRVCHPGVAVRFDPNARPHHHLICLRCSTLIDFEERGLDALRSPRAARRMDFEVRDHTVQFRGICARCRHDGNGLE